ncbi:MAG: nucleotide pyrophosphohydrolase [Candidatus Hydrogenedentes bacterium]|nr:nucleotide pyrophosphohydrolase [Candidatus Hydrogenedentota bacterium]
MTAYPHLPHPPATEPEWHQALIELARYLRTPEGCPWDREQDTRAFAGFLRDESAEYVEALEGDDHAHMAEECGDSLFTLLASIAAAEEAGLFTYEEVLKKAHEKMIRRHDHVFGDVKSQTPEEAVVAWERVKQAEKRHG